MPKLIIRHNIGLVLAANWRLLLLGQFCRLRRSSAGPTTAAFVYCLNLSTFSRNLAQYRPYIKPIVTFTMASSYESRRARFRPMDGTLLGHVSLLPRQTILGVRIRRQVHDIDNRSSETSLPILGQCWAVSNFALGMFGIIYSVSWTLNNYKNKRKSHGQKKSHPK